MARTHTRVKVDTLSSKIGELWETYYALILSFPKGEGGDHWAVSGLEKGIGGRGGGDVNEAKMFYPKSRIRLNLTPIKSSNQECDSYHDIIMTRMNSFHDDVSH